MELGDYLAIHKTLHSGLESRAYDVRDPSRWPRGTLFLRKLALTSSTSGGRSVSIARLRTQATEFSFMSPPTICWDAYSVVEQATDFLTLGSLDLSRNKPPLQRRDRWIFMLASRLAYFAKL
jgi:hypothetical protein